MAGLGPGGRVKRKAKAKRSASVAFRRSLGAQLTEREGKLLSSLAPRPGDSKAAAGAKLKRLTGLKARVRKRAGAQLTEKEGAAFARGRKRKATFE